MLKEELSVSLTENLDSLPELNAADILLLQLRKIDSKASIEAQLYSKDLVSLFELVKDSTKSTDFGLINANTLVKNTIDKMRIERKPMVVPEPLIKLIKSMCHEGTSGHLGFTETDNRLTKQYFWRRCYKDIEDNVKTCDPCQREGKELMIKKISSYF